MGVQDHPSVADADAGTHDVPALPGPRQRWYADPLFGIAAAMIVSLAVAFAILPLEGFIRRRLFGPLHDRLPTGNPL